MNILLLNINMVEEVLMHESVVGLRVKAGEVDVLVHVEGYYIFEGYLAGFVEGY